MVAAPVSKRGDLCLRDSHFCLCPFTGPWSQIHESSHTGSLSRRLCADVPEVRPHTRAYTQGDLQVLVSTLACESMWRSPAQRMRGLDFAEVAQGKRLRWRFPPEPPCGRAL
eukprot:3299572-Pleurochrysis_carterae.AAC.1